MNTLMILELIVGVILSLSILLQHRASGLSATFGGIGSTYIQRRGSEKLLFQISIWSAVIFFGLAVVMMYIK